MKVLSLNSESYNLTPETSMKNFSDKIYASFDDFFECLKTWKTSNQRLVFTNGCFDLVHRGHIDSLSKCAAFGDKLIIGLNSDESVRRLKGAERPLVDQESRAMVLAALEMVDAVIYFEEDTPYELIGRIIPDVLVKGEEYAIEEIAGYDIVLNHGGEVKRIKLTEGHSTSALIDKIKKLS